MPDTAEQIIYNRLAAAPTFHPASVSLFLPDWGLEPGDVVTVKSGTDSYSVPVYYMNLEWRGQSRAIIQSTGNEKREPLPALKRQQYGGGSAAYEQEKRFRAYMTQMETDLGAQIGLVVEEIDGVNVIKTASIVAAINDAGSTIGLNADKIFINDSTLDTEFSLATGNISTLVTKTGINSLGANETLYSLIDQNAQAITLKVSQGDVATQLAVEVGNVTITGGNLVVDGMITASNLATEIANISGRLDVHCPAYFYDGVYFADGGGVTSNGASFSNLYFGPSGDYDAAEGVYSIGPATESNGQITIPWTRFNGTAGTPVNFNIAATQTYIDGVAAAAATVTLSGAWINLASAGKSYQVTASNGAVDTSPALDQIYPSGNKTWDQDNKGFSVQINVDDEDGETLFYDSNIHFDTTPSYNAGWGAAQAGTSLGIAQNVLAYTYPTSTVGTFNTSIATITATDVLVYDSTTHTYTATAGASYNNTVVHTDTDTSGTEAYDDGWAAARAVSGLSISGNALQYLYPLATVGQFGIQTKYITATSVLTYDSTTHTYTATAGASYDSNVVDTQSDTSGTEAYDDGYSDGEASVTVTGASGWSNGANTLSLSNGSTYTTYMPAQNSATWMSQRQGTNYLVYCTVGGREYSHTFTL